MTWNEIVAKHPRVAKAIDGRLAELKDRIIDERSGWLVYARAKVEVAKRIGWFAPLEAVDDLRSEDSFESAMRHVTDVLEI